MKTSTAVSVREPVVDRLTVVAIAAIAISLTVGLHEGVHALTCVVVGGDLLEYSALYESCGSTNTTQADSTDMPSPWSMTIRIGSNSQWRLTEMHIAQKVSPAPRRAPLKTTTIASINT